MSTDNILTDRLTIKDLIFTKALPNYIIPVPTDGYKIFPCTDCGDKFLFESSYEYHINRKSLKISYFCRHCMKVTIFYNRCKLLAHIRSHAFKTATITVSDIKIEVLPLENFNLSILPATSQPRILINENKESVCHECNKNINIVGIAYKDRAAHYMLKTKEGYSCPICMFLVPTLCALRAHLRIHLNIPPFFCPECGMHLPNKVASYPFDHDCDGFKMMKSATRYLCKIDDCGGVFHPKDYKTHYERHLKKVYRCSYCLQMWYNESMSKCSLCKNGNLTSYMQCPLCPNKLFSESLAPKHLTSHCASKNKVNDLCYPCSVCNEVYRHLHTLINHHRDTHSSENLKTVLSKFLVKASTKISVPRRRKYVYHRVVKKCSKCLRSFTYRCLYESINNLPTDCPFKCTSNPENQRTAQSGGPNYSQIVCCLCKTKISEDWNSIKVHYAEFHRAHKCLDIQVLLKRLNKKMIPKKKKNKNVRGASGMVKSKSKKKKIQVNKVVVKEEKDELENHQLPKEPNVCIVCNHNCENTKDLETHLITHRDPCMAYQCLECGKSFVVKPSFSTHLLLEHGITDVQQYIDSKPCYNESALLKSQNISKAPAELPVRENQCRICREQFQNSNDLEKHFRVHGMAFLMKNAHKNNISP